ncbi:MAG: formate dehydrogenase subunit gamma [Alphaproteobacteria bacterium]|nr:formate dehydrogenase subunit gamma [Alphaproteobacteria bacterium]
MFLRHSLRSLAVVFLLVALVSVLYTPAIAQVAGQVPGDSLGATSDSEFWRGIRQGNAGQVSIPNAQAGILIQSEGDNWRAVRNGPLSAYGAVALLGMVIVVALFFAARGRIRVEAGLSNLTIERFSGIERFAHWLMAGSFIVLALTGLNLLYGRYLLIPVLGPEVFAAITELGKYTHNYLGFAFMVGLALSFVLWVVHNIPNRHDAVWLLRGGVLIWGGHPPAKKFNAGQKILFWLVMLGGLSVSLSGIALIFPFQTSFFADTFALLNGFGLPLPTQITPMEEQQLNQVWHTAMSLVLVVIIIAHIYIGSVGMEGAFDAMGNGEVDLNWAKEHHPLWVEEIEEKEAAQRHSPAE